jgi:hypothetical protein
VFLTLIVNRDGINLALHSKSLMIPLRREDIWDDNFNETIIELYNLKVILF